MTEICYSQPDSPISVVGPLTINTTETVLATVTDQKFLRKVLLSLMYDVTLGSATKVSLRYYFTKDGTTWFPVPVRSSTNQLSDVPAIIDSTSYSVTGTQHRVIDQQVFLGSIGFQVTGQAAGATATLNSLDIFLRDY